MQNVKHVLQQNFIFRVISSFFEAFAVLWLFYSKFYITAMNDTKRQRGL